jgi:uncharacterized protein
LRRPESGCQLRAIPHLMLPAQDQPITPAELFRLEQFMQSDACGKDSMNLSRAHGFLTAAVSGPEAVLPEEWIRLVFDEPVFVDATQADEVLGLILRVHRDIESKLPEQGAYLPLFEVVRDSTGGQRFSADAWCGGYVAGMTLAGDLWAAHRTRGLGKLLTPLFIILNPQSKMEQALRNEQYAALCDLLPQVAEDVYQYWLARRTAN